jgi:hypothetical protein
VVPGAKRSYTHVSFNTCPLQTVVLPFPNTKEEEEEAMKKKKTSKKSMKTRPRRGHGGIAPFPLVFFWLPEVNKHT